MENEQRERSGGKIAYQIVRDVVGVAGVGLLSVGAGMYYLPLGLMAAGGSLLALAIAGTLRGSK
jgi:hypothetical protein